MTFLLSLPTAIDLVVVVTGPGTLTTLCVGPFFAADEAACWDGWIL